MTPGQAWFLDRLAVLGYRNYEDYLSSPHWKAVKRRYKQSRRPKKCVCCGSHNYQLHHNTYERLGKERLTDFTPLCEYHHKAFHAYLKAHPGLSLKDTKLILEAIKPPPF